MKGFLYHISQNDVPAVLAELKKVDWDGNSLVNGVFASSTDEEASRNVIYHPLVEAVRCESSDVIEALVSREEYPFIMSLDQVARSAGQETSPIHMACQTRNAQILRTLLRAGANPNFFVSIEDLHDTKSTLRYPPLLSLTGTDAKTLACRRVLLEYGANPNAIFHKGHTLLHWDCLCSNIQGAALLLQFGADANHKPPRGTCPSHIAYWTRNLDLGQLLKQHGATFGAFYEVEMYQTIEAYLESGDAKVDECPFDGLGLLHACAFSLASVDIEAADHLVQVALRCGVNLNVPCQRERQPTALMIGCGIGNASLSLAILQHCPESHTVVDDHGCTCLFYAVGSLVNTRRIMERLVQVGANLDAPSTVLSRTALHEACLFFYEDPQNLRCLIRLGANLDAVDDKGWTGLHYACLPALEGNLTSMRVLLEEGAHVNARDYQASSPLHLCCMDVNHDERRSMVRLPVESLGPPWGRRCGSDGDDCDLPLKAIQLLLSNGADPVAVDKAGNMPFFYLCHTDGSETQRREAYQISARMVILQAASHRGLFGWIIRR